jgi:GntR family transcriptional regulator/MocR family aminotransferase
MTIERRMEMIEWAGKNGGLIVEDDYDSEYRYAQKPIPAMQGLDSSQRTIYIGSFSKVVFPALSMGYAVVPQKMIGAFEKALSLASRPVSFVDQLILDDFIREGHFGRHLRRMRKTHAQRREVFVDALARHLPDRLQLLGSRAGLHCTALLNRKAADHRIARKLEQIGIVTRPLSAYYMPESENKLNGLALGFACANPTQLRKAIRKSASII